MDFIIGGADQGKCKYVFEKYQICEKDVFYGDSSPYEALPEKMVIKDFHLLMRRFLEDGYSVEKILHTLENAQHSVIITDEVGCGIVPVDPFERKYRETTGRICCVLAKRAEKVVRVMCGIPTVIKNEGEQ